VTVFKERQEYMKNNRPVVDSQESQSSSESSAEAGRRDRKMEKLSLTDDQIAQIYEKHLAEYKSSGEVNIGGGFGMMGSKGFGGKMGIPGGFGVMDN